MRKRRGPWSYPYGIFDGFNKDALTFVAGGVAALVVIAVITLI